MMYFSKYKLQKYNTRKIESPIGSYENENSFHIYNDEKM